MAIQVVDVLPLLPPRPRDAHKGDFGRVLVVAGSRGMSGAAALCASAALRGGAGLVRLAVPAGILPAVQSDRQALAVRFAAAHGVVLVLKGQGTVVTDGTRVFVNTTGNPGMATGGTGDVLGGLIAALLGQGLEAFAAAQLGVFLHGR